MARSLAALVRRPVYFFRRAWMQQLSFVPFVSPGLKMNIISVNCILAKKRICEAHPFARLLLRTCIVSEKRNVSTEPKTVRE